MDETFDGGPVEGEAERARWYTQTPPDWKEPSEHCRPADRVPAYGYVLMVKEQDYGPDLRALVYRSQIEAFQDDGFYVVPAEQRGWHPGV